MKAFVLQYYHTGVAVGRRINSLVMIAESESVALGKLGAKKTACHQVLIPEDLSNKLGIPVALRKTIILSEVPLFSSDENCDRC